LQCDDPMKNIFDIHGGGIDLVFPHHENEIAQSCCAFGTERMANIWMHNGFLQVEGRKMAKSEGNFVTINELLNTEKFGGRRWPGEVLRLAMLMTHYREPIDFSVRKLEEALGLWRSFAAIVREFVSEPRVDETFVGLIVDDLATSAAIARLHELKTEAASNVDAGRRLLGSLRLLGFFNQAFPLKLQMSVPDDLSETNSDRFLSDNANLAGDVDLRTIASSLRQRHPGNGERIADDLEKFVPGTTLFDVRNLKQSGLKIGSLARLSARRLALIRDKNWAEADKIRDELLAEGIQLKDGKDPATGERITTWEVKR
jgi:cysteinyl-tRNA synthetase